MPSANYGLAWQAMHDRRLLAFAYNGAPRIACPVILGYGTGGDEKIFVFQTGGRTSRNEKLPNWKCLSVEKMTELSVTDGQWLEGARHQQTQTCIRLVDIDVNVPETLRHKSPLPVGSSALRPPRT